MSSDIENHVDWVAASIPNGDRLGRPTVRGKGNAPAPRPSTPREVMNVLLGESNLSASDLSGSDPYNATGRHLRR